MPDNGNGLPAVVHQASGMVAAQLQCSPAEALGRIRILAESTDGTLEEIAEMVLAREVRFNA